MAVQPFPQLKHLAPVLVVDQVEPCVAFWVDRFGFRAENQVPGPDGTLVFASVAKDGIELMYQARGSVPPGHPAAALYFTVADLNRVEQAVTGAPVYKARHQTPYGSTETYVQDPAGTVVGFAQF